MSWCIPYMNKSEEKAYNYLKKEGYHNITFRTNQTPDFKTDNGYFEVKRGYETKTGDFKILFSPNQRDKIQKVNGKILVFVDGDKPIDILQSDEVKLTRIRKIILYNICSEGKERLVISLDKNLLNQLDELIKKHKFDDRQQIIRRALYEFLEGKESIILA